MSEDNSLSSAYNRGYFSKSALAAAQSLSTLYVNNLPDQTLDSISRIRETVFDSLKSQVSLNLELQNLHHFKSFEILQKTMSEYLKESLYSKNAVSEAIKTIYSKEFLQSINIHLQTTDKLNSELLGAKPIVADTEPFDEFDKPQDPPETPVQSDYSKQLITEVQNRLYNLSHNIIAPFRNKTEMSVWIAFYITQNILESNHVPLQIKLIIVFTIAYQLSNDKHD